MFRGFGDWLNDIKDEIVDLVQSVLGAQPDEPETAPPVAPDETDFYAEEEFDDDEPDDDYYEEDEYDERERFEAALEEWDFEADAMDNEYSGYFAGEFDAETIRNVRYATFEDAQNFLEESGLIAFSEVVYFEDEDTFGIAVLYEEPQ